MLLKIYGLAAMSFMLLAIRDYFLFSASGGRAGLLGQLLIVNILSSAATDYVSNNRSILSSKAAGFFVTIAWGILCVGSSQYWALVSVYVLSSVGYAYACGVNVSNSRYHYPAQLNCIELVLVIFMTIILPGLDIRYFVCLRLVFSTVVYISVFWHSGLDIKRAVDSRVGGVWGLIISMMFPLVLAQSTRIFFDMSPGSWQVLIVRVISYMVGALSIGMNIFAEKLLRSDAPSQLRPVLVIFGTLVVCVELLILLCMTHVNNDVRLMTVYAVVILLMTPVGMLVFRVSSRLS
jgi:hypothetical protein